MNIRIHSHLIVIAVLLLALAACGGGGDDSAPVPPPAPPPPPPGMVIGAAGGTVSGPNGAQVVIPAGALASDTRILVELVTTGAPPLPTGFTTGDQMFAITPHGTTFSVPVTVTIPFDPASVPAGQTPAFYKTNAQNQWEELPNAVFGTTNVSAQVTSFSIFDVLHAPLVLGKPVYQWEVYELKGDALVAQQFVEGISIEEGLAEHYDFGAAWRDAEVFSFDGSLVVPSDDQATAQFAATADGSDWWVGTEAPLGITGVPTDTVGMEAVFRQTQSFIKRESDATLSFFIIEAFMQTSDLNGVLGRGCPGGHLIGLLCDAVSARLYLEVEAFTVPAAPFDRFDYIFRLGGSAELTGIAGSWDSRATTAAFSRHKLWNIEDFEFDIENFEGHEESLVTMKLSHPIFHEYSVDLSSVEVGQAFTLHFFAIAKAYNRAASAINGRGPEFETSAQAYLRDPRRPQGMNVSFAGLDPIETQVPVVLPPIVPVAPEPCVPGPAPDPAAGTIQFDSAAYTQSESNVAPAIIVTRTGGSSGAVTATFSTSDGSAIAGTDYTELATTVFFADGDNAPRLVTVSAIPNSASSEPDKTVNLALSQPGGCAALGGQTTAILTIQDDDLPPPPTLFTVGGTVTGLTGPGLVLENHIGLFLPIAADGPFTFSNIPSPSGTAYFVRVFNQPHNGSFQTQACTVTNGSGTFSNANVTNVVVTCENL
jgi:hypothetical protein